MPTLPQMYALANARSGYSRPEGEIYSALDEGGFLVYTATVKEMSGFFLKFDATTIVLTPGQQEYTLPPDLTQLVHIAERQSSSENWRPMKPTSLADALDNTQQLVSWDDWCDDYGSNSEFGFYGPYLTSAAAVAGAGNAQTEKIRVEPAIDAIRMCQIAYLAKWLPVVNAQSTVMLPLEGTYAMQNYAVAELTRANNDTLSREYEAKGDKHLTSYLTWVRQRQTVQDPQIDPYLSY